MKSRAKPWIGGISLALAASLAALAFAQVQLLEPPVSQFPPVEAPPIYNLGPKNSQPQPSPVVSNPTPLKDPTPVPPPSAAVTATSKKKKPKKTHKKVSASSSQSPNQTPTSK